MLRSPPPPPPLSHGAHVHHPPFPSPLVTPNPASTLQLWAYMHFCMRLRAMDERDMSGVEAEVWREISDAANATFNWLAFDRASGTGAEVGGGFL